MFTSTLLHSVITDDAEDLYSNNSDWNHGINKILDKLHILRSIIMYEKRIQLAEGSGTTGKIKQPTEDFVADNCATV